jgi:hypothetical protein
MKKFLLIITLLAFLGNNAVAGIFSPTEGQSLPDPYINFLVEKEVLQGYADGTMRKDDKITRAEFVKITLELAKHADEMYPRKSINMEDIKPDIGDDNNCFLDVRQEWYSSYICYAKEQSIVQGYKDGKFYPNQPITLVEAAEIFTEVFKIETSEHEIWYRGSLEYFNKRLIMPPDIFSLTQEITRGDAAIMAVRLFIDGPGSHYCPLTIVDFQNNETVKFESYSCP